MTPRPRVLLSYSHDSPAHAAAVLALSDRLRASGVDARIDQYDPAPTQGWPAWMRQQIEAADHVLCVCTPTYKERFEQRAPEGVGLGASWEGFLAETFVYQRRDRLGAFVPVFLAAEVREDVPVILSGLTFVPNADSAGFEALLRVILREPAAPMPPVGPLPSMGRRSDGMAPASTAQDRVHAVVDELEQAFVRGAKKEEIAGIEARLREAKGAVVQAGGLHEGDEFAERFRLLRKLGDGGFATVWAAWQRLDKAGRGRLVAIKILDEKHRRNQPMRERFRKGADDLAAINDRGVVRVHDTFKEHEGIPWFTMEVVPHGDLHSAILTGWLSPMEALERCLEVADTLHRLHEQGLVHCDVKPPNVLLASRTQAILSDFDLVRNLNLTVLVPDGAFGDHLFAAPEQHYLDVQIDRRVDVHGLAVTALWCLASGKLPKNFAFKRQAPAGLSVPADVVAAVLRGAEVDPDDRPSTVAAWAEGVRGAMFAARSAGAPSVRGDEAPTSVAQAAAPPPAVDVPEAPPRFSSPGDAAIKIICDESEMKVAVELDGRTFGGRTHFRLLLALGRARRDDAAAGDILPEDQGWRSLAWLAEESGLTAPAISVLISRLRRGFEGVIADFRQVVESIQGQRLRTGFTDVAIIKGGALEPPNPSRQNSQAPRAGSTSARVVKRQNSRPGSHLIPPLVTIPAGRFLMGSPEGVGYGDERPQHAVELTRPYAIGVTPVTQARWKAVVVAAKAAAWAGEMAGLSELNPAPSHFSDGGSAERPVENVSWLDVITWCNALSRLTGRRPAYGVKGNATTWDRGADGFRLPTEAEWEHAARAGTDTPWSCGSETELGEVAWYNKTSGCATRVVAQKRANSWGLHDVHGNVWEWCWDWFDGSYYATSPPVDPVGPPRGVRRVVRGGSYWVMAGRCCSAYRSGRTPGERLRGRGFRLVLSPPPSDPRP